MLPAFDFRQIADRIASTYRSPVAAVLPLSEELIRLGSGGLFAVMEPNSAYAKGIAAVVELIEA